MERQGVAPDDISYSAALVACRKTGGGRRQLELALGLFEAMQQRGVQPTTLSCTKLIEAVAPVADGVQPALAVARNAYGMGHVDVEGYRKLLSMIWDLGYASQAFAGLPTKYTSSSSGAAASAASGGAADVPAKGARGT